MRPALFAVLTLASLAAAAGDVYKWTDEHGNVHYGDKPKTGGKPVDVRPASGDGGAAVDAAKAASASQAECERLRSQYDVYSRAAGLKETDNLGRTREYTAEERQALLDRTAAQRDKACAQVAQQ